MIAHLRGREGTLGALTWRGRHAEYFPGISAQRRLHPSSAVLVSTDRGPSSGSLAPGRRSIASPRGARAGSREGGREHRSARVRADRGVHIRPSCVCAPGRCYPVNTHFYVVGCLVVAVRPPGRQPGPEGLGAKRERPRRSACPDRHRGGSACASPCRPPPRGRSRLSKEPVNRYIY